MGSLEAQGRTSRGGLVQTRGRVFRPYVSHPPEEFSNPRHGSTIDDREPPEGGRHSGGGGPVVAPRRRLPFRHERTRFRTEASPPAAPARRYLPESLRQPEAATPGYCPQ